jgi:excisionase family DNA binding protein
VNTTSALPRLLTIKEAAEHLRVCTKTVYRMIKSGQLPAVIAGRQKRIRERDLRAYLDRGGLS